MKKTLLLTALLAILLAGAFIIYNGTQKSKEQLDKRDEINLGNKKENVAIKPAAEKETKEEKETDLPSSDNTNEQDDSKGDYANFYVYDNEGNKIYLSSLVNTGKPV